MVHFYYKNTKNVKKLYNVELTHGFIVPQYLLMKEMDKEKQSYMFFCIFLKLYFNYNRSTSSFLPPNPPVYPSMLSFKYMTSFSLTVLEMHTDKN